MQLFLATIVVIGIANVLRVDTVLFICEILQSTILKPDIPSVDIVFHLMSDPWEKARVLFRQELKNLRLTSGLTQADLAERLKKPQSYVSKLESGDRSLDCIETREFCLACGVSFERFVRQFEKNYIQSMD